MRTFNGVEELAAATGETLGESAWVEISQERINAFADATGDHQWIHVDAEKAAHGPFKTTIAHGLLTLSLLPMFLQEVYHVNGVGMAINYGFDRVRFPTPVPVGARLRAVVRLVDVAPVEGGVQARFAVTIEIEGGSKPACAIESLVRYVVSAPA